MPTKINKSGKTEETYEKNTRTDVRGHTENDGHSGNDGTLLLVTAATK